MTQSSGLQQFEIYMEILRYALRSRHEFSNGHIQKVVNRSSRAITRYLTALVDGGYLVKMNWNTYRITPYAKELMGVK